MDEHPALATGSCYAEFVGARVVPGLELQLERAFVERRVPDPAPSVGLPSDPLEPMPLARVRRLGAHRLVGAAEFAAAAPPRAAGRDAASVAARRVVASLGRQAGIDNAELAFALGVDANSIRRLQEREAPATLVHATRLRLAIEQEWPSRADG